jgi:hypothetical protein
VDLRLPMTMQHTPPMIPAVAYRRKLDGRDPAENDNRQADDCLEEVKTAH